MKFPAFMEPESPSPYPQVPATCPYPEPTPSSPHDPLQLLEAPSYTKFCYSREISYLITKFNSKRLNVKTQLYIYQTMVTANNDMFRPLTGHHQVVHLMKRA